MRIAARATVTRAGTRRSPVKTRIDKAARAPFTLVVLSVPLVAAACAVGAAPPDGTDVPEPVGGSAAALNSGSGNAPRQETAGDWGWHSTVSVNVHFDLPFAPPGTPQLTRVCTGVLVDWTHVMTTGDCVGTLGGTSHRSIDVGFFWNGVNDDAASPHRNVLRIFERDGVQQPWDTSASWVDAIGCDANVAILELDGPSPRQPPAWLPSDSIADTPVASSWAYAVGLGPHDDVPSTAGLMFEHGTTVRGQGFGGGGSYYSTAHLLTQDSIDGAEDEGGPLYQWSSAAAARIPTTASDPILNEPMKLVGIYTGQDPWDSFGNRAQYYMPGSGHPCAGREFFRGATGNAACAFARATAATVLDTFATTDPNDCENVCNGRRDATGWSWSPSGTCQVFAGTIRYSGDMGGSIAGQKYGGVDCAIEPGGICHVAILDDPWGAPLCDGISTPPPPPPPCGGNGGVCCTQGTACTANGTTCDTTGHCTVPPSPPPPSCGGNNEVCCAGSTCPGSTNTQPLTCLTQSHVCIDCGNPGQACCYLDANPPYGCTGNYSCVNGANGYVCQCDRMTYPNGCN
jgi:hypothetical protein